MYACTYAYIYIHQRSISPENFHTLKAPLFLSASDSHIYRIDAATAMVAWGKPNAIHFSQVITVFIV